MTSLIFNFCNILILIAWGAIIISPQKKISEILISYPWIPLTLSFFYIYFIIISGGLMEADFSSLNGIVTLFKKATPESAAAGWLHYLAFDFWVGTWIIKHSRKEKISNKIIVLPLLFTFILGPVGILVYSLILLAKKSFSQASET
ncbi:MAG: hypothetical protein CMC25_05435 [Flavobacteriaceae bacterium]|nr:hypothetical protein [Flavobacteriaceae bacterium]|tara:strand:- start:308 stop:745 length:438 start_codon:yes stop_codon:yes gene_type:complete